jgi:hypothetical protein
MLGREASSFARHLHTNRIATVTAYDGRRLQDALRENMKVVHNVQR